MCKSQPTDNKLSLIRAWSGHVISNFWGSNYITDTAEPKVVKSYIRVGYINSSNKMTYHQQKSVIMVTVHSCVITISSAIADKPARRAGLSTTAELFVMMQL